MHLKEKAATVDHSLFELGINLRSFKVSISKHRDRFGKEKKKFYILVIQYPKYF